MEKTQAPYQEPKVFQGVITSVGWEKSNIYRDINVLTQLSNFC